MQPGDIVTITDSGREYRILYPGEGRVGSKLRNGEPYERKLLTDIRQRHHRGTAFDIGAHLGNHTLYLAAICGLEVHAWEPHEQSLEQLRANLDLNPTLRVTVHDWAAGATDTRGRMTPGRWLSFDPSRDGAAMKLERGHIPVHRIDDHLDVDDLTVVKVDVEGMEADALQGCVGHLERCLPVVYAESHTVKSQRSVGAVLKPLGYRLTRTIHMGSPMDRWDHPKGPR